VLHESNRGVRSTFFDDRPIDCDRERERRRRRTSTRLAYKILFFIMITIQNRTEMRAINANRRCNERNRTCYAIKAKKAAIDRTSGAHSLDADAIAQRVHRKTCSNEREKCDSALGKSGPTKFAGKVLALGTQGKFDLKFARNGSRYRERVELDGFEEALESGFDLELDGDLDSFRSWESELSGTIRSNCFDGCERSVFNTYVRTQQWANERGINRELLRAKVVGLSESSVDAIGSFSMKRVPTKTTTRKNTEPTLAPPQMPKGKTVVIALAFAIKPKIAARIFVNLEKDYCWRAEVITPEGVDLWSFDEKNVYAHREHAAGHVSWYETTTTVEEEVIESSGSSSSVSFARAPYYGTKKIEEGVENEKNMEEANNNNNNNNNNKVDTIDVVRCEGGHFLAETSRGYFFIDFSTHVSGIDKAACDLDRERTLKIVGHTSSLGVGSEAIKGNIRIGDNFSCFGNTKKNVIFWEQSLDAAARLPGTLSSPVSGSLGLDAIANRLIRLNCPKRVPGSRKNPKITLEAFQNEAELKKVYNEPIPWTKLIFIDGTPYVDCYLNADDSLVKTVNSKSGLYKLSMAVGGTGIILSNRVAKELDLIEQKQGLAPGGILSGAGEDTGRLARVSNETFTIRADSFRIGRFGFKHETIRALTHLDGDPPDLGLSVAADGIICADLFRGCCVLIDEKNERMAVTAPI